MMRFVAFTASLHVASANMAYCAPLIPGMQRPAGCHPSDEDKGLIPINGKFNCDCSTCKTGDQKRCEIEFKCHWNEKKQKCGPKPEEEERNLNALPSNETANNLPKRRGI